MLSMNIYWPLWAGTVLSPPRALPTWLSQRPSEAGILSPSHWRGHWGLEKWRKLWASKPRPPPFPQPRTGEPVRARGARWAAGAQQICGLGQTTQVRGDKTLPGCFSSCWLPSSRSLSIGRPAHRYRDVPVFICSGTFCSLYQSITKTRGTTAKRVCSFLLASVLQLFLYKCPSLPHAGLRFQGGLTWPPALGANPDRTGPVSPYQCSDAL